MDKIDSIVWAVIGACLCILLLCASYGLLVNAELNLKQNAMFVEIAKGQTP